MPEREPRNGFERFIKGIIASVTAPGDWVRENVVVPNQKSYPWYHQKFRRVPTIDQCYTDDPICYYEANAQYRRDRQVDSEVLNILRKRFEDCSIYEAPDHLENCSKLYQDYKDAETNWFIKYGDLGGYHNVKACYMKQKHRLLWERRHGPVGSGKKQSAVAE